MNIDSVASAAVEAKSVSLKQDVSTSVQKEIQDLVKTQAELVLQLIDKMLGVGQNIDALA